MGYFLSSSVIFRVSTNNIFIVCFTKNYVTGETKYQPIAAID